MVFTATVESVNVSPVATMIYPPRTTMAVGFKDSQMLKGEKIDGLKFLYTATQGRDFTPGAGKNVLVISGPITNPPTSQPAAVQPGGPNIRPGGGVLVQPIGPGGLRAPPVGPGMARPNFVIAGRLEPTNATIQMMVEATDANVATARKATGVATSRPDSAKTQADSKS